MPKALTYRANSVIYFQGDAANTIFILKSGKVSLNYSDIETHQDIHELIQTGEFFGVKSALGKYPREENALVLTDASVLIFTVPEFEQVASANIPLIMKMLKVFSNQLRRVHRQVENLLEKEEQASPEVGLFKTGEYYLRNRQYDQATYVFSRYLTYYPTGKMAREATRNIEVSEASKQKYGQGKGPQPQIQSGGGSPAPAARGPAAAPDDDPAPTQSAPKEELSDSAKQYYNAVSLFTQEKYQQAYIEFKKIIDAGNDAEYVAKAMFEQGRCIYCLNQYDGAIAHFTKMLQTYPRHPDMADALFCMGQCYDKKGDKAKAANFYKKILSMQLDEDDSTHIKARRALKAIEG